MALVPYTITAIERDTADATASGKQVVVGAVCSMFIQPANTAVLLYDDANGSNGSTAKTTGTNGQVTVYIYPGSYRVSTNGISRFIQPIQEDESTTIALILSLEPSSIGDVIQTVGYSNKGDSGGGLFVRSAGGGTPSQSPSQLANATVNDATGSTWSLVHNGEIQFSQLGATTLLDSSLVFRAYANSNSTILDLEGKTWLCSGLDVDDSATRTLLRDNPVKNGSLNCDNRFNNITTIKTESVYKKDDIALTQTKSPVLAWSGLGVLWLGTSIPHQAVGADGYPERFGERLNCNVYNWAWSGSHAFYDISGDAFDAGTIRALSMTEADRLAGLALYGAASVYDDSFNAVTKASEQTVEYRVKDQFIANTIDVVMLDHNHNDRLNAIEYTDNIKTIASTAIGASTVIAVNNTTGLSVGDACYLRVVGVDNLDYAAGRITDITGLDVTVAVNSTGYAGTFTSGTLIPVDRNTIDGAWDFLIAYIKNMSIVYGDGNVKIVLCNAPSNYTNNSDPDFPIWSVGRAIAGVATRWNLSYYDVANDLEVTFRDHLIYLPDAVHPSTPETRTVFANHWVKWASGGAIPNLRPAEFLERNESIENEADNFALYSKYDKKYAPRSFIFEQDALIINEDFSGGLTGWTIVGAIPSVVSAPWGAGDAVQFDYVDPTAGPRIQKAAALGQDGFLSFDVYFSDVDIAIGSSKQATIASLTTANATVYNVNVIQSQGSSLRLAASRVDGNVSFLQIELTEILVNTKYTISFDVTKGATTSDDGNVIIKVNGAEKYAGYIDNGGVSTVTGLQVGSVFSNMGSNYTFFIGNIEATSKTRKANASWFDVGTAAFSDITTSPTDITAGRLTKVGDFGLGNVGAISITDWNNVSTIGFYSSVGTGGGQLNTPPISSAGWFGHVIALNSGNIAQYLNNTSAPNPRTFFRIYAGSVWGDWVEFYHSGNSVNPLDFGIGIAGAPPNSILNNTTAIGVFSYVGADAANPSGTTRGGSFIVTRHSTDFVTQSAFDATTTNSYIRESGDNGVTWSAWATIFNSGNTGTAVTFDVTTSSTDSTPGRLTKVGDFGIGSDASPSITNFAVNIENGHYSCVLSTVGDSPDTEAFFGLVIVNKASDGSGVVYHVSRVTNNLAQQKSWIGTRTAATGSVQWSEIFTDANSVNPLDFGVGALGSSQPTVSNLDNVYRPGFYNVPQGTATNIPSGFGGSNSGLTVLAGGTDGRTTQLFSFDASTDETRLFVRHRGVTAWSDWQEILHSGNTNLNRFEGTAGEICQTGFAASGTSAWFFFDILKNTDPTGITTTGTFDVYRNATLVQAGVTILFSNISSKRKALVTVSGLSGLTTNENLQLRFASAASVEF